MKYEFIEFLGEPDVTPPEKITEKILTQVKRDLNPSGLLVFSKLVIIQAVTGFLTLLFCPQFGIALTSSLGLMPVLMKFGEHVCMVGCGVLFLGMSSFCAFFFLKPQEVRVLGDHTLVQFSTLTLLTAVVFMFLGAPIFTSVGLAWLGGALGGSILVFKTCRAL